MKPIAVTPNPVPMTFASPSVPAAQEQMAAPKKVGVMMIFPPEYDDAAPMNATPSDVNAAPRPQMSQTRSAPAFSANTEIVQTDAAPMVQQDTENDDAGFSSVTITDADNGESRGGVVQAQGSVIGGDVITAPFRAVEVFDTVGRVPGERRREPVPAAPVSQRAEVEPNTPIPSPTGDSWEQAAYAAAAEAEAEGVITTEPEQVTVDDVPPRSEERVVHFLKGHAVALRDMLQRKGPLLQKMRPAILGALASSTANAPEGPSVSSLAVRLTVQQIQELANVLRAGRGTLGGSPGLLAAFERAFARDRALLITREGQRALAAT